METGIPTLTPGSLGNIYIYSQPKLRIEDFVVHATLDSARVNGVVWVTVVMANSYRSSGENITRIRYLFASREIDYLQFV